MSGYDWRRDLVAPDDLEGADRRGGAPDEPDPWDHLADAYREHAAARRARTDDEPQAPSPPGTREMVAHTSYCAIEEIHPAQLPAASRAALRRFEDRPTCVSCQHWDASEPPRPTRRDPRELRRRCGLLSSAQDDDAGPVLLVPLSIAGSRSVAAYTPPGWHCDGWKEREAPAAEEGGGRKK